MIGIEVGISDNIFKILIENAPQKLSSLTLAESVGLSEEVLIQGISDFKRHNDDVSDLIFIDRKNVVEGTDNINHDRSTYLIWIPAEFKNRVKHFLDQGGFGLYYDKRTNQIKEEEEKREEYRLLSIQNLRATTHQAQDSLKRAKRAEMASWIAIIAAIASVVISVIKK